MGIQVGEEGAGCGAVALSQRWSEQAGSEAEGSELSNSGVDPGTSNLNSENR